MENLQCFFNVIPPLCAEYHGVKHDELVGANLGKESFLHSARDIYILHGKHFHDITTKYTILDVIKLTKRGRSNFDSHI